MAIPRKPRSEAVQDAAAAWEANRRMWYGPERPKPERVDYVPKYPGGNLIRPLRSNR